MKFVFALMAGADVTVGAGFGIPEVYGIAVVMALACIDYIVNS